MTELINYLSSHYGIFLLVLARVSSLLLAFPIISTKFLPFNIRILLALSFSFFILPYVNKTLDININTISSISFLFLILKEILIGIFLAFITWIFYGIVAYAAELISYMMGLTIVNSFDPSFGIVSVLGRFFILLFLMVFFSTGAYRVFFGSLFESFKVVPIGNFQFSEPLFKLFIREGGLLFYLGFKMAFPFILSLFIVNLALALINRLIPQINVFIVGLPIQIFVGTFFLLLGFQALVHFLKILNERFIGEFLLAIKILGG